MLEQKRVRSPPTEEEAVAQRLSDELTTAPVLCPSALLGKRSCEKTGSKISPGKKGGLEDRYFNI